MLCGLPTVAIAATITALLLPPEQLKWRDHMLDSRMLVSPDGRFCSRSHFRLPACATGPRATGPRQQLGRECGEHRWRVCCSAFLPHVDRTTHCDAGAGGCHGLMGHCRRLHACAGAPLCSIQLRLLFQADCAVAWCVFWACADDPSTTALQDAIFADSVPTGNLKHNESSTRPRDDSLIQSAHEKQHRHGMCYVLHAGGRAGIYTLAFSAYVCFSSAGTSWIIQHKIIRNCICTSVIRVVQYGWPLHQGFAHVAAGQFIAAALFWANGNTWSVHLLAGVILVGMAVALIPVGMPAGRLIAADIVLPRTPPLLVRV